jgi:hypothetical protein
VNENQLSDLQEIPGATDVRVDAEGLTRTLHDLGEDAADGALVKVVDDEGEGGVTADFDSKLVADVHPAVL